MKKLTLMFASIAFTLLVPIGALAQYGQDNSAKPAAQKESMKGSKTLTGCLQKGDEPGEFSLTADDGKVWGLKSSSVKLEEHLGHKVSVKGTTTEEAKGEHHEKKEAEVEKASKKEDYGDIRVTSVKMISDTCK